MDRHPNDLTTDKQIDAAIEGAKLIENEPRIIEAIYRADLGLDFLMLRLSDGRRLLIPREELSELKNATAEQASDITIGPNGTDIYWPKLDDGLYLPDFLEHRWHRNNENIAA
jgi:hypothetical protein